MSEMNSKESVNIFLAGDSTVADCPGHEAPMDGWGQVFDSFFAENVMVHNYAKGGASSNSFIEEGRLQSILEQIQPGDYLFIQFGHNDQKSYGTEPFSTYQSYLKQYVTVAREKRANPVLITSVQRRSFDEEGNLVNTLGDYPKSMIQLAENLETPLIDLWEKTGKLYQSLGPKESKQLFVWFQPNEHPNYPKGIQDNTHFCEAGAKKVAGLVSDGIKELQLPIARYIKY